MTFNFATFGANNFFEFLASFLIGLSTAPAKNKT